MSNFKNRHRGMDKICKRKVKKKLDQKLMFALALSKTHNRIMFEDRNNMQRKTQTIKNRRENTGLHAKIIK